MQQLHALQALNTLAIAAVVARGLELGDAQACVLCVAALLHLVGLRRLTEALRHEALPSTKSDIQAFRDYPSLGTQLIRSCADLPRDVADIVAQHRERLEGSGFPARLCGTQIQPFALYVGVIQQFVSLTTRSKPITHTAVLANLYRTKRTGFGDEVNAAFLVALTAYPPGTFLSLTDASMGRMVRQRARAHASHRSGLRRNAAAIRSGDP